MALLQSVRFVCSFILNTRRIQKKSILLGVAAHNAHAHLAGALFLQPALAGPLSQFLPAGPSVPLHLRINYSAV